MKIGSLFSGAGGLDLAVREVFGGDIVWHSELDPAASKILAHHYPNVPNLGDITKVDWSRVEPVEVLGGGFPCQDVSAAGKRAGIKEGTRSGLWALFADAIDALRPRIVVIENVRGLLSAEAHRDVESENTVVGNGPGRPVLRAAGAVLGDLADLGYDAQWATVAASSVGAPHKRERVFILAHTKSGFGANRAQRGDSPGLDVGPVDRAGDRDRPGNPASRVPVLGRATAELATRGVAADATITGHNGSSWQNAESVGRRELPRRIDADRRDGDAPDSSRDGWDEGRPEPTGLIGRSDAAVGSDGPVDLLPTPKTTDARIYGVPADLQRDNPALGAINHYFPTPSAADGGGGRFNSDGHQSTLPGEVRLLPTPTSCDYKPSDSKADLERHSPGLGAVSHHFLPTPAAADGQRGQDFARANREGSGGDDLVTLAVKASRDSQWGKYEPAIRLWENATRPAPPPTEPNKNGNPRLSARFSEWLMGWPDGWVTAVPGISRNDQLRIVGNGVCPQQAVAALRLLIAVGQLDLFGAAS